MSNRAYFNCFMVLLLILLMPVVASAKRKLEIHRCELNNGTIAFQEKPCKKNINKKSFSKSRAKSNFSQSKSATKTSQKRLPIKNIQANIDYQQFISSGQNDESIHNISDRVKSYNISMQPLKRWHMFKKVYNDKLLHIKFLDNKFGSEISLMIDFIYPDDKKFSENELTDIIYLVGSRFVRNSSEGRVSPRRMRVDNGIGIMATFTHKTDSDKYKYTSKGAIFKGKWLIQFTLKSSNKNSFGHQFAINTLFNSLRISN